jgi:pimeloyl-ACP methyl ester carboxylesterase
MNYHFGKTILMSSVVLVGMMMNIKAETASDPPPAPPGKLVDVGWYKLHIHTMGQGKPTVVLVYGSGAFSVDWALVQPQIARFAQVVSYDRAGDAWSDSGPQPQTLPQEVYELHTLLQRAKVEPPYVLVGHSFGGILVRWYARQYPKEVAGMILEDATDDDTVLGMNGKNTRVRTTSKGRPLPPVQTRLSGTMATPEQIQEIQDFISKNHLDRIGSPFDRLPKEAQQARIWGGLRPAHYLADDPYWGEEFQALYKDRHSGKPPLGDIPLIVLIPEEKPDPSAKPPTDEWKQILEEKRRQKVDQARLSRRGRVVIIKDSGHEIHLFQPDALVKAVREIVDEVRKR